MLWFADFARSTAGDAAPATLRWPRRIVTLEETIIEGGRLLGRIRVTVDLDPELRRRMKVAAAGKDETIKDFVERAIERELERQRQDDEPEKIPA